ncbi:type II toxin-antitoxin system RelB/DinJ family antitoxin [Desulfovibrio sp. SGI.169]|uniref:type II toxin-antitoxin system RelB/DinJ family antitoxin n=1 Tax=Desulfovibrio sp. SGI.169 TaxID=3420561 RepID=UPI003D04BE26
MPANDYVRARIDPVIKNEAAAVLAKMGLTVSDLCRMALTRVAHEKRLPFSMEIPNEETRQALEAIERREGLHHAKDADDLFRQLGI